MSGIVFRPVTMAGLTTALEIMTDSAFVRMETPCERDQRRSNECAELARQYGEQGDWLASAGFAELADAYALLGEIIRVWSDRA